MQIIISKATASAVQASAEQISALITGEEVGSTPVEFVDITDYANISLTQDNKNVTVEINDELFFKYMHMYLKVAKLVAPFIKPIMALISTVNDDMRDIERFINQKK